LDNSDSYIEQGAIEKLRYAVEMEKITLELSEHLATSLTWMIHYCKTHGIPLPNQDKINLIVDKALSLSNSRSTENLHREDQPQNGQNHKTILL